MKQKYRLTNITFMVGMAIFCCFTINCISPEKDDDVTIDPSIWEIKKQAAGLGKGVNLGNALDAPVEGAWGGGT